MSAAELMTDLERLGIRIEARGDRLRYSPRSAVTPDLADRMKAHKGELLSILSPDAERSAIQWCESAPRHEVRAAVETALAEWDAVVAETPHDPGTPMARSCIERTISRPKRTGSHGTETPDDLPSTRCDASMANRRPKKLTDQVRQSIKDSGLTRRRIAQDHRHRPITLAKFHSGKRGLSLANLDLLCEYLGLRIVAERKPKEGD